MPSEGQIVTQDLLEPPVLIRRKLPVRRTIDTPRDRGSPTSSCASIPRHARLPNEENPDGHEKLWAGTCEPGVLHECGTSARSVWGSSDRSSAHLWKEAGPGVVVNQGSRWKRSLSSPAEVVASSRRGTAPGGRAVPAEAVATIKPRCCTRARAAPTDAPQLAGELKVTEPTFVFSC